MKKKKLIHKFEKIIKQKTSEEIYDWLNKRTSKELFKLLSAYRELEKSNDGFVETQKLFVREEMFKEVIVDNLAIDKKEDVIRIHYWNCQSNPFLRAENEIFI